MVPTTISLTVEGNLLIDTSDNSTFDQDRLEIRADVTNAKFIISDPNQILVTTISPSTTSPDQHSVEIPFSSAPNAKKLLVDTFSGDDFITLSAMGGSFNLSPVINGGDGFDDINSTAAVLVPTANEDLFLSAENIRLGGDLTTNGGKITLDGNVFLMSDVSLTTVGASAGDVQINGQLDSAAGPSVYTLITTPRSYADALAQAGVDVPGGYLVTIRSADEQAAVKAAAGNSDVWIGASDGPIVEMEGTWRWESGPDFGVQFWNGDGTTGTPVNGEYSNWFPGEPDDSPAPGDAAFLTGNDTIGGSADPGGWSDGDVNTPRAYIVESPTTYSLTVNSGTANVQLNGSVGNLLPLKFLNVTANQTGVFGGSISTIKSQTYNSAVAVSGPALFLAEEVDFGGGSSSVTGSTMLTLAPIKRDAPINVGAALDAGEASFDITDTDIAALATGFMAVLIGEPPPRVTEGTSSGQGWQVQSIGPVTITSATFLNPLLIAGGSISVTQLDAGTNKVELIASNGSITDGGDAGADITAGDLALDSATGVGSSSNALETTVASIAARGATSGGVFLANTGNLSIGSPLSMGGIFTNNDVASVTSTGSITVLQPIFTNGGDVSLTAASGIAINGVPIDTAGGQFTADADSNNDGTGTFLITSLTDFVDWTSTSRGTFADGTTVDLFNTTLATASAQFSASDTRFSDGNIYSPAQASGDFVETHFSLPGESVTFSFANPQYGLFLHFDGMQYEGTPFDPMTDNPINLYSFDHTLMKVSGESTWEVDTETNSIRQISGDHLADQDGTVRFDGGLNSLTLSRAAAGVSAVTDSIVNVQLGLFRAGLVMTAGAPITIRAADVELDGFLNADSGLVSLIPSDTNRTVDLGATGGVGQFILTDAELDQISTTSGIVIGDSSTGNITIKDAITRSTATNLTLTVASDKYIEFGGANATLVANGGNVTLTTGGTGAILSGGATADIRAAGVTITSGSGGIGALSNPLSLVADALTSSTSGNADQFLSEANDLTIDAAGLSSGTGTVFLDSGVFKLGGPNRINDSTTLSLGASATLQLDGFNETLQGLVDAGFVINGSETAATLTINASGNSEFFGTLGGAGTLERNFALAKSGAGTLALSGSNNYGGTTTINEGVLRINGSTTSATTVASGGTLGGSGTITGAVTVNNGGTVAPGNSPGILHTGDISFAGGSTFAVEVNGDIPLELHDQLDVTGTVNLGGATLSATGTITTLPGQLIVLINNDGIDAIVGTFAGLAEGATVTINGVGFVLSYRGGTGNDVTLTESGTMNFLGSAADDAIELREATISGSDYLQIVMGGVVMEQRLSASVTDLSIAGSDGNDMLTIDYGGSGGFFNKLITFDGGNPSSGLGDSLVLTGGSFTTVTHLFTNASDGSVTIDGTTLVTYTGLEPIADNLSATDRVFSFGATAETITLTDAAGSAMTIDSPASESVTFANPSGSLTINAGAGDDVVQIVSVDAAFDASLTVNGSAGIDVVQLNADITFAAGNSLAVTAETVSVGSNADLVTSGSGTIQFTADDLELAASATVSSATSVSLIPQTAGLTINLGTEAAGSLSLTDSELDRISAATIQIGDTSNGTITVSENITRATATNLTLTTGGNSNIDFSGSNATLDSNNGSVTLTLNAAGLGAITSGGALKDVRGTNVSLTSGSGGIGANGNSLITDASSLNATTNGNAAMFLEEIDSVTIDAIGLSAGTGAITLASGTFRLGGSNRVNDGSSLGVSSGAAFQLNGFDETVASLKGSGSVINGTASAATLTVNLAGSDTFSGVLGGAGTNDNNFGLTKSGAGTLTLSGANSYTGATTITNGTLRYGAFSVLSDTTAITVSSPGVLNLATFGDIVGSLAGDGTVTLGSAPLEVGSDNTSTTFSGTMNGTGQFIKNGSGTFTLSGTITAGGNVTINEGTFRLGSADRIADNRFVAMGLTGILDLNGFNESIGGLSGSVPNRIMLGNGTLTTGGLNIDGSFFGAITGTGSLVKVGTAILRLERTNAYTGATNVNAGTLLINGSVTSNVTVASGATVGGTGSINSGNTLTVQSGGTVAPGTSPGILNSGNVTLQSGSAFNVELNGTTVGTQYDQLNVTGTVTIGSNVTLNASLGFTPSPGDTFVVINNDASDAISGTFNGLAQGALLSIGGEKFHIVYNHNSGGGNTNDVALIANRIPVVNNQSFSISESSSNGAAVGTVLATDADSVVTFAITGGNTGNVFALSASTGQITVNDATGLDFETNPTINLTVEVTDDSGATDSATITINVTNAPPSAPVDGDAAANSISEAAINGDTVGIDADSTDAHGGAVTFQLTNDAGGRFTINSTTGVVRVADASLLDFESASSHTITVEASDGTNASTQDFTIAVTNVAPSVPSDADVTANGVPEGAINGDLVGIDADSGDAHGGAITFSLTDDAGGRFAIHPVTGIVRVADASLLNFEDAISHVITVQASDGTNSTTANFTISVTNVAPAMPIDGDDAANVVSEGIANGDPVGIDANSGDVHGGTITFSLTDDGGGRFAIDSATGVVTVADATLLDFSAPASHTITVQASDGTDVATKTFTINVVGSAPDAPLDVDDQANTIPEGALEGSRVGITLFATDPQGSNVFYRLTDNAGGRFAIDPLTGVVMVKDGSLLRFSDATQHTIRAVAIDAQGNASAEVPFDINVTQVPVDAMPLASILPTRVSVVEGNFGPNFVTFLVKLNKPSSEPITIDFTTRTGDDRSFQRPEGIDDTIPFATDEPGLGDFFRSTGQLTFDPGVTEQPLRVQIRPDDRSEDNELFFVQLLSPVNVKLAPQQSIAIARILDDDSVPQLLVETSQVLEGDSAGQNELVFTVRLVGDLALGTTSATADYSTGNIAIDTAVAGTDYTATSGTLTFTDTERLREVRIPILGDLDDEVDETVSLRFENPINLGLSRSEVVGTILNDDSPNVVVLITPQVYKIREGNDASQQVEFLVTLVGKPTGDVSVNYTTADETATAGSDYTAVSGTLNFTLADIDSGNVQRSLFVTTFGDTDIELDETLNVTLSLPDGSLPEVSLAPDRSSSRVVLRNDDQAILTEDGDSLAVAISNELTTILGAGPKNNPALIAALRARALEIIQTQGLSKAIVIIIDPVDFVLTDPDGRQAGYTEGTGVVNQIPGTYYSGDGTVELMIVPLPPDGSYNVQLAGLGGDFNASITVLDSNGTSTNIVSQALSEGATSSVSFQVGGNNTIPVGLGLAAANSGAAPAVGVVGAFGQRELQAALAAAFQAAVTNGLEFDGPDSESAELMLWLTVSTRVVRQQFLEPLWQSLGLPFGDWLGEGQLTPRAIPSEIVDQFWSQVGQTLTGVPSSIYRLGDMLENVIPSLLPGRNRSTPPRAGEQGQSNPAPNNNGVRARRSSLERPRVAPQTPPAGSGQTQPPSKPNATKGKSTQAPESPKEDNQQSSTPRTRWLWFTFKDGKSAVSRDAPNTIANWPRAAGNTPSDSKS